MIQPLGQNSEVEGYDSDGIAEYIFLCLEAHFPFEDWLEEYGIPKDDVIKEVGYALKEIGMC